MYIFIPPNLDQFLFMSICDHSLLSTCLCLGNYNIRNLADIVGVFLKLAITVLVLVKCSFTCEVKTLCLTIKG